MRPRRSVANKGVWEGEGGQGLRITVIPAGTSHKLVRRRALGLESLYSPKTLLSIASWQTAPFLLLSSRPGRQGTGPRPPPFVHVPHARHVTHAPPTPLGPRPRGQLVTLSSGAAVSEWCCASAEQAIMASLRGLRLAAGHCFRLYDRNAAMSLRSTRINGFCTKPQESAKAPSQSYRHRVPLHKPTDFERKILLWSGRFKKEEEIPETISFEMLDAAKNRLRVKVSYLMIALTVMGCIYMVIEGKKAAKRHESLTSLNLERKARLREEAVMKDRTE